VPPSIPPCPGSITIIPLLGSENVSADKILILTNRMDAKSNISSIEKNAIIDLIFKYDYLNFSHRYLPCKVPYIICI
jgi:hypothetical protein